MADYSGKAQFFVAFRCAAEHEAEGDRVFAHHAEWMERTHPKEGEEALLQYTVSKSRDDEGNVQFLLAEVYETTAGIDNHRRLSREDEDDSGVQALLAWVGKCDATIGWDDADVVHSLW
jgi:quinol monooxygenase YgiN